MNSYSRNSYSNNSYSNNSYSHNKFTSFEEDEKGEDNDEVEDKD